MLKLFEAHGYLWPRHPSPKQNADMFKKKYMQSVTHMENAVSRAKGRRVAIQAGGHCGMWALWLADRFGSVYTWEPEPSNFACLTANVRRDNVFAARGMLGETHGPVELVFSDKYIGAHHGSKTAGTIPVYRIDDLALPCLDVLILDIEGMELPALKGGAETIAKNKPPIHLEDRALGERYGFGSYAETKDWLAQFGYQEVARVAFDVVLAVP